MFAGLTQATQFTSFSDCTCPQHIMTYNCKVAGNGFTVWRGSAFDCVLSGNEIILSHSSFGPGAIRTCNDGHIVGRSLSMINNTFTSQLDVNVTSQLIGKSVECLYETGSSPATIIGSDVLSIITGKYIINIKFLV